MHCHHYATLFTRLALQMRSLGGPELLARAMEENFYLVLKKYYIRYVTGSVEEKIRVAEDYFALVGMGSLSITFAPSGGKAEMRHSHVDEGWIEKWGRTDYPVNFMGNGYLAAVFALAAGRLVGGYRVEETESIVTGAPLSRFVITEKGGPA